MKRLIVFLFVIFLLVACGTPRASDWVTVRMYKEASVTMHADKTIQADRQAVILAAAEKMRRFTSDRARISVIFDLDYDSITELQLMHDSYASTIRDVLPGSVTANAVDLRHPSSTTWVQAETAFNDNNITHGASVTFIVGRFAKEWGLAVAMHEFGHVVGFDHTKNFGDVMSAISRIDEPVLTDFTAGDLAECRRVHLCD